MCICKKEIGGVCSLPIPAREAAEPLKCRHMDLQWQLFAACEYFWTVSKTAVAAKKGPYKLFLFLIYFFNEMAPRCTADVVFYDADEPFGAGQLIMSSVYCYKIGLPGNNHLRTRLRTATELRQGLAPLRQRVKSYSF